MGNFSPDQGEDALCFQELPEIISREVHLHGSEEQVWKGLQEMFTNAQRQGEVSMVVTITNAAD